MLDELVAAAVDVNLTAITAERRAPYANKGSTNRLYLELAKPRPRASQSSVTRA